MKKNALIWLALLCMTNIVAKTRKEAIKDRLYAREESREQEERWQDLNSESDKLYAIFRDEDTIRRREMVALWRQNRAAQAERDEEAGRFAHLYAAPHTWDVRERYAEHRHQFRLQYDQQYESRMFDGSGATVDCSVATLTERPTFEDMLMTSKLVGTGALQKFSNKKAYVEDLATTPINFNIAHEQQSIGLSYAYALFGQHLTLGVTMPFVRAQREITYRTEVSDVARAQLEKGIATTGRNADFVSLYGYDANGFFDDILRKKNMRFVPVHRVTTTGDITLFGHAGMSWRFVERLQVGAAVTLPYAKNPDLGVFHQARVGNGGFIMLHGHLNIIFKEKLWGYPHFSCALEIGMPASVTRRVPKIITVPAGGTLPTDLATVELVKSTVTGAISEPECTVPAFAQHTTTLSLQPGLKTSFRAGLIIMPFAARTVQADLAYELAFKTGDSLHGKAPTDEWYTKPFATQPHQVQHRLHAALVWQPADHIHWHIGGFATVMGREAMQRYGWRAGLSYQW